MNVHASYYFNPGQSSDFRQYSPYSFIQLIDNSFQGPGRFVNFPRFQLRFIATVWLYPSFDLRSFPSSAGFD